MEPGKIYYADNEMGRLLEEGNRLAMNLHGKKVDGMMWFGLPYDAPVAGEDEIRKRCKEIDLRIKELQQ